MKRKAPFYWSLGGRLTSIESVLSAISIYWMSLFRIPVHIRKYIDKLCRRFLWYGDNTTRKKYYLVA
jgi:hypothetical protein